jgi:hypothetical protein
MVQWHGRAARFGYCARSGGETPEQIADLPTVAHCIWRAGGVNRRLTEPAKKKPRREGRVLGAGGRRRAHRYGCLPPPGMTELVTTGCVPLTDAGVNSGASDSRTERRSPDSTVWAVTSMLCCLNVATLFW